MAYDYFSRNGELLPTDQATVPLDDIAYSYGFGVYETIRVTHGTIYFLDQHTERFLSSAEAIGLSHNFSADFIADSIRALIDKNQAETCNVKALIIGGNSPDEAKLYIQLLNPLFPDRKLYSSGAHFVTEQYVRRYPQAKTLNMLPSYLAYRKASEAGAYDALLVDHEGYIREGTRTNFFALKGQTIFTPPGSKILPGVMRQVVLKIASENGFQIESRDIGLSDLDQFEAAFVTSVSSKIMPARLIDDYQFGERPEALNQLMKLVNDFLENCADKLD